jgi:TolB-like protein/Tfp pilus assembly protein PilF
VGPHEGRFAELAGAILDGTSIDWTSVESSADLSERPLLDQLKLLAAVADVHRRPSASVAVQAELSRHASAFPEYWGHLRVLEPIGRGAFGDVYRAWDTRLDREVALKLLPARAAGSDSHGTSIIEEGRLLARVRHPNVVTIYGAERIENHVGLWMELVRGRTLQQMLELGNPFSPAEVVTIGIELCRAVEAVHAAGLVHRDIKPHNVMMEEHGREVDDESAAGLAGTPLYMAPELLSANEPSVESDIYSLGVLLYHLLTRSYPVRANSLHDLRLAHSHHTRTPVRTARPDVSPRLARIIDRALMPRPQDRYQSARSLGGDLTRLRGRSPIVFWTFGLAVAAALVLLAWVASSSSVSSDAEKNRARSASGSAATTASTRLRSIAVLPFKPVAGAEADERLQHGMTEAVTDQLNRIGTLRVESPTKADDARDPDPLTAGRALGVDVVVQGYVQQAGSGVQVRLQVLRTIDGAALVGNDWHESVNSILEAQRRLAESVARALELTPAERSRIGLQDTRSSEAFQHYSFGRYHLEVLNLQRMQQAETEFREAIRLDPRYARAHAALALTFLNTVWFGGRRGVDARDAIEQSALDAIALDESLALPHTVLGHLYQYIDYAPFQGQREHLRAMELDPRDLHVLRAYSFFLLHHNAFDEAFKVHRQTLDIDAASPLSTMITAEMLYVARRYDECVAECQKALALEPNDANLMLSLWLGRCLEHQGKRGEAIDVWEKGRAARGNVGLADQLRHAYRAGGWEGYWRERVRTTVPADPGVGAATIHARLGNFDAAMQALERAYNTRSLGGFANYPDFDPLRSDPRFEALRVRTGSGDAINAQLAAARASARR